MIKLWFILLIFQLKAKAYFDGFYKFLTILTHNNVAKVMIVKSMENHIDSTVQCNIYYSFRSLNQGKKS